MPPIFSWKNIVVVFGFLTWIPVVQISCQSSPANGERLLQGSAPEVAMTGESYGDPLKSKPATKLSSFLNRLLEAYRLGGMAEARVFAANHNTVLYDGRIQVTIVTREGAMSEVREAVRAMGGDYQLHYRNLLQAVLPIAALEELAQRPDVMAIREPHRAVKP